MPTLADPNFFQTVTYISEHNANGALGLVINRPLNLTLGQLLEHLNLSTDRPEMAQMPVYHGGPVQPEQGFVLHSPVGHWGATLRVTDEIGITTSRDILQAVAVWRRPANIAGRLGLRRLGTGSTGTGVGRQCLAVESPDFDILFRHPSNRRWLAAAALLGIDLNLLSAHVGHA
jgi:putative transcriptional regulator